MAYPWRAATPGKGMSVQEPTAHNAKHRIRGDVSSYLTIMTIDDTEEMRRGLVSNEPKVILLNEDDYVLKIT